MDRTNRTVTRLLVAFWALSVVIFAAAAAQDHVPLGTLVRDPQTTTESAWYLGLLSTVGVVGWAVAAAIFGFGAYLAHTLGMPRRTVMWWGSGAALVGLLLVDDFALLHDDVLYRVFDAEEPVLAVFGLLALAWVVAFRAELATGPAVPLILASVGFGASLVVDLGVASTDSELRLAVEDGAKFLGIWSLAAYAIAAVHGQTAASVRRLAAAV